MITFKGYVESLVAITAIGSVATLYAAKKGMSYLTKIILEDQNKGIAENERSIIGKNIYAVSEGLGYIASVITPLVFISYMAGFAPRLR